MIWIAIAGAIVSVAGAAQTDSARTRSQLIDDLERKLVLAKRIYFSPPNQGGVSEVSQAILTDAIRGARLFIVTEDRAKADLILRASGTEITSQEFRASKSVTGVQGAVIGEAEAATQTVNDARLSVRLVTHEGDVVWSSTQESKGGKYRGAIADAGDRIVRQLARDVERLSAAK